MLEDLIKIHTRIDGNLNSKKKEPPALINHCACGHYIKENCYIYSSTINEVKILGNCCIKRYLPKKEERKLKCDECGEPHQNRKVNRCNSCKNCDFCDKILTYDTCRKCPGRIYECDRYWCGKYNDASHICLKKCSICGEYGDHNCGCPKCHEHITEDNHACEKCNKCYEYVVISTHSCEKCSKCEDYVVIEEHECEICDYCGKYCSVDEIHSYLCECGSSNDCDKICFCKYQHSDCSICMSDEFPRSCKRCHIHYVNVSAKFFKNTKETHDDNFSFKKYRKKIWS